MLFPQKEVCRMLCPDVILFVVYLAPTLMIIAAFGGAYTASYSCIMDIVLETLPYSPLCFVISFFLNVYNVCFCMGQLAAKFPHVSV
jgi:hypothetical protein